MIWRTATSLNSGLKRGGDMVCSYEEIIDPSCLLHRGKSTEPSTQRQKSAVGLKSGLRKFVALEAAWFKWVRNLGARPKANHCCHVNCATYSRSLLMIRGGHCIPRESFQWIQYWPKVRLMEIASPADQLALIHLSIRVTMIKWLFVK